MFISISESVEQFLNSKNESEKDVDTFYKPKISCFRDYLFTNLKISDDYDGLQKVKQLDIDYLFESMKYYVAQSRQRINKQYHVYKIGSLHDYLLVVLKDYFEYLNNSKQTNEKIILEFARWKKDPSICNERIYKIALDCELISKEVTAPFIQDEIDKLLDGCNKTIDFYSEKGVFLTNKHQDYKLFTSALILKLIYFTGIKYRVIKEIKYDDVDCKKAIIKIGKYYINMPMEFAKQLEIYKNYRNKIPSSTNSTLFFLPSEKTSSPYINTFVAYSLRQYIKKCDTTGLSKYTIIKKYMKSRVPEIIIKDITTYEDAVINDCKTYLEYLEDYSILESIVNDALKL